VMARGMVLARAVVPVSTATSVALLSIFLGLARGKLLLEVLQAHC
jgi:hypothetical protein